MIEKYDYLNSSKAKSISKDLEIDFNNQNREQLFEKRKSQFQYHAYSMKKNLPSTSRSISSKNGLSSRNKIQIDIKIPHNLCAILRSQQNTLLKFKEWVQREKNTIKNQFENLESQISNFMTKSRLGITECLDNLYIQLLETFKEIKNITQSLYLERKSQNKYKRQKSQKQFVLKLPQSQNSDIIKQLIKQKELYRQYYSVKNFYQQNQEQFKTLSEKLKTINELTQKQLLQDLNIQLSLKQFQNYIYSSLKQVKNKLIWDKSPTIFDIK